MSTQKKNTSKPIIEGIIIPARWNDNGKVTGVSIQANDESVYLVECNKTGEELLGLIHKKVEATGKIRECLDGRVHIRIRSYKTIEEPCDTNIA